MRTLHSTELFPWAARLAVICCCAFAAVTPITAQRADGGGASAVTAQVELTKPKALKNGGATDASNVVVWLTPLDAAPGLAAAPASAAPRLVQRDKMFEPHLLVVVAGTAVEFPNQDPFLHNVFSLFDGKRFDLGFYEAGASRTVRFDRAGVSFLFCNIHPEMSAVVVAVPTRYYGVSDHAGHVSIAAVPDGRYRMEVWAERSLPDSLKALERTVTISSTERTLPIVQIVENPSFATNHKNKFGQDYVPPAGSSY